MPNDLQESRGAEWPPELVAARVAELNALAGQANQIARKEGILADLAAIEWAKQAEERGLQESSNFHHHYYHFGGDITSESVGACLQTLHTWHRQAPDCPIEVCFTSPGGEVVSGLVLFDSIRELVRQGHHVVTSAKGVAASMAAVLLQAGKERVMSAEAWLLLHEVSFRAIGKMGEIDDTTEWAKGIQTRLLNILARRANISADEIRRQWTRKDWWLDSEQCLAMGFVDRIL